MTKRTMQLADDSGKSIEVTLWGNNASSFPDIDASSNSVVAFKGLRVSEWNEKSLTAGFSTTYEVNPEQEATERLKTWWESGDARNSLVSLSQDTRGMGGGGPRDETSRTTTVEVASAQARTHAAASPLHVPASHPLELGPHCCSSRSAARA